MSEGLHCPRQRHPSEDADRRHRILQAEIARCHRELAAVEAEIRSGNPDLHGLCQALADWSAELRILEQEARDLPLKGTNS